MDNIKVLKVDGMFLQIAETAGIDAAHRLSDLKGGTTVYIPGNPVPPDHWLVQAVGEEAAEKIIKRLGGGAVEIPFGLVAGKRNKTRLDIQRALASGLSTTEIAKLCGVHVRTVRYHKNRQDKKKTKTVASSLEQTIRQAAASLHVMPEEFVSLAQEMLRTVPKTKIRAFLMKLKNNIKQHNLQE